MNGHSSATVSVARAQLEELWRNKLEEANHRLRAATANYNRLLREAPDAPAANALLARARQERLEAQNEYARLLKIFTELTLTEWNHEGPSAASTEELR